MNAIQTTMEECKSVEEYLQSNGISPSDVDNYSLSHGGKSLLESIGAHDSIKGDIVSIFYKDLDRAAILDQGLAFRRVRLSDSDIAKGHPKYLSPLGSSSHLYIPMLFKKVYTASGGKTIYITEGEKKADVACAHNIPCLALHGVYNFLEGAENKHLLEEMTSLIKTLSVETAVVVFDSDGDLITKDEVDAKEAKNLKLISKGMKAGTYVKNPQVRKAAYDCALAIAKETKIKVSHGFCKHIIEEKTEGNVKHLKVLLKNGLDDWLSRSAKEVHKHLDFLASIATLPISAKERAYEPLGYMSTATETTAVVYRKDLDEIKFAPYTKFTSNAISMLIGESDAMRYQRESDSGLLQFDTIRACRDIKTECDNAGRWTMDSIKELGLWKTASGQLVVNTQKAPYLIIGNKLEKTARFIKDTKEYFTARRGQVSESTDTLTAIHNDFPTHSEVAEALNTMGTLLMPFSFEDYSGAEAAYLLISWLLGQLYTGITEVRPHIYVDGPAGCGKTTILKVIAHALKGHAQYIANGRDSSVAGIMGMIGKSATTMIIDEMEISDKESKFGVDSKLEAFMGIIKSSYSSSEVGVDSVKGTQDGGYRSSGAKAGFLFASLDKGTVDMATETRILTLTVRAKTDAEATQGRSGYTSGGVAIDSEEYYALAEQAGAVLMRYFMADTVHEAYIKSISILKKKLYKKLGLTGRMLNTFAYLYAPLMPVWLYSQTDAKPFSFMSGLAGVICKNHKVWSSTTRPAGIELLDKLLHAKTKKPSYVSDSAGVVRQGVYIESTVGRLIAEVVEHNDENAEEGLNIIGIFFSAKADRTEQHTIVYMHSSVMKLLTGSDAKKFKTLETIIGVSKEERKRFNGAQHRVIGVPYSVISA